MRPPASFATALGVFLPLACAASATSEPEGHAPAVAPDFPPERAPAPVTRVSEPAAAAPAEPVAAGPVDDCGLRATLAAERHRNDPTIILYTLTLKNEGTAVRTLVEPGDSSEAGWRTPMLAWSGTRDGKPASQLPSGRCGNMNPIDAGEIFTLEPGASRMVSMWISGPSYAPGRYEVRLRYTNDPGNTAAAGPEVASLLARTSACDVTSDPLTIQVP